LNGAVLREAGRVQMRKEKRGPRGGKKVSLLGHFARRVYGRRRETFRNDKKKKKKKRVNDWFWEGKRMPLEGGERGGKAMVCAELGKKRNSHHDSSSPKLGGFFWVAVLAKGGGGR